MPLDCEITGPLYELLGIIARYRTGHESAESLCAQVRFVASVYQSVMMWKGETDEPTKEAILEAVDEACFALQSSEDIVLRFVTQIRRESINQFDPQSVLDLDPAHHFALPI